MDMNVDTELFIGAVKNQPAIWDCTSELYYDRIKKRGAWFVVCEEFFAGFNEKPDKEKNEIGKRLIKRWKNIIDNYKKAERKKETSGQGAGSGRRYLYARQLSFLQTSTEAAPTENSIVEEEENENGDNEDSISSQNKTTDNANDETPKNYPSGDYDKMPAAKRRRVIEKNLINFMKQAPVQASTTTVEQPDDDKSFFDSIIPAIKPLSMDNKLEFRCEVMGLVSRYRSIASRGANRNPNITTSYHHTAQFDSAGSRILQTSSTATTDPSTGRVYTTLSPYGSSSVSSNCGDSMDIFSNQYTP